MSIYNKYNACVGGMADEVEVAFESTIKPIWDALMDKGYDPREISHHWQSLIAVLEAETVLRQAMALKKLERDACLLP